MTPDALFGQPATSIIGFDSAWGDRLKAPGAICTIRIDESGQRMLVPPALVSFDQALAVIESEKGVSPLRVVAIDQPTVVPNLSSLRPVDRLAAPLISWLSGGVQPANRSKIGMFDDTAPVWHFKERLGATESPEASRNASAGLSLMEVFPALALPSLDPLFCGRLLGARDNPARRKTFTLAGWQAVIASVHRIPGARRRARGWADTLLAIAIPRKVTRTGSMPCSAI